MTRRRWRLAARRGRGCRFSWPRKNWGETKLWVARSLPLPVRTVLHKLMRPAGRLLVAAVLLVVLAGSSLANDLDELLGDDFNASERCAASTSVEVAARYSDVSSFPAGEYPRPGHLSPEEDWKFELPPHVRRRGISHAGSMMGMRRLVKRRGYSN